MIRSIALLREKKCDFAISAGNTGALMAGSLFNLGRIPGIDRPAIGMTYPIMGKGISFLVDAGANAECKPGNLLEFATMGSIYMNKVLGVEHPTVGLVNIGSEEKKGTTMLKETYQLLKKSNLNFIGNVEARDIPYGAADVIVSEAFVGNVILKLYEGVGGALTKKIKAGMMTSLRSKIGALLVKPALKATLKDFDASEYGGAPLLGLNGLVVKTHGSSTSKEVCNSIIQCVTFKNQQINEKIRESIQSAQEEKKED